MNNLKRILLALAVILTAAGVAQSKTIAFGVRAGMNVNKLKFDKSVGDAENSCGWTAGVFADINLPFGIGADAGLMYARMNNKTVVESNGVEEGLDPDAFGQNFLEIPINLKYKFSIPVVGNVFSPYIFTGPSFGLRLDKGYKDVEANIKSRTFQMTWNLGIGLQFFNHVQIAASYGFGCNNVVEAVTDQVNTADIKAKNNYWTITAAYVF